METDKRKYEYRSKKKSRPWKNGHYLGHPGFLRMLCLVDGNKFLMYPASGMPIKIDGSDTTGTLTWGDFGDAHPDVARETGKDRSNVKIKLSNGFWEVHAVLSDDCERFTFYGMAGDVDRLKWMSEEDVVKYKDMGDPADAIPCHYRLQPQNQGKLLWISGAPGIGKSTTGHLLSKKAGFVYYEADAFLWHLNPYIHPDVDEKSMENLLDQNILKGVSQKRLYDVSNGISQIMLMCGGMGYDFEKVCKLYSAMCLDITKERQRIGGDWAVAQAVTSRAFRDHIRSEMGEQLIFIILHMDKDNQVARLKERHGDDEMMIQVMTNVFSRYEPAAEDEPNVIQINVTKDMSRNEIVQEIRRRI